MNAVPLIFKEVPTSIGQLVLGSTPSGLCLLDFKFRKSFPRIIRRIRTLYGSTETYGTSEIIELAEQELQRYLEGSLKSFSVPLDIRGSDFQLAVWNALITIPYGTTCSYQDIANKINRPASVRAVANANGQNGIVVIIPCHRVIGSDGSLTGYGGGLPIKKKLLRLESTSTQRKLSDFC